MEALSSLVYKGSITEAILEAKRQKKLFVVYISGDNDESARLMDSTWTDATVADSLSKYCILLHIQDGSSDAANFSAIYPYSSVPCITAVGFNGAQVWKNEGFIAAEVLASSLEKAWLSLHIQETTASILSAALSSQKSETSTSAASSAALPAEGGSSGAAVASLSTDSVVQPSERESLVGKDFENKVCKESTGQSESSNVANDPPALSVEVAKSSEKDSFSHVEEEDDPGPPATAKSKDLTSGIASFSDKKESHGTSKKIADRGSGISERDTKLLTSTAAKETKSSKDHGVEEQKTEKSDRVLSTKKSSDVHLNIRLPDGASLQERFSLTSTLRIVKDFVNRQQTSGLGAYDLAIPYPRKVFSDQDLCKSLSDLGLFDRQALIVVPRQRATAYHRGGSSYSDQTNPVAQSENASNDGYFAYVRKLLSYVNPFSYFGGGASSSGSGPESQTSMWEYGPNPGLRNNLAQTDRQYRPVSSTGDPSDSTSNVRNRRPTASRLGSNIHTLKHDDDDGRFSDRNAFWNGNSTQYGGDNDGRR